MKDIKDLRTAEIPFFRTAYNYDRSAASVEAGLTCEDPSRTQQNFRDECDINTIVERFGLTGELPENVRIPQYGDFTNVVDFQSAMNAVRAATESFDALPAALRARFGNDPGAYVDFCSDPANVDEMVRLGLAVKKEENPPAHQEPDGQAPSPKDAAGGA